MLGVPGVVLLVLIKILLGNWRFYKIILIIAIIEKENCLVW
jgi:hypothetical protein